MQTLKLRSQIGEDGKIQLQLPQELANQEVEIILVYQTVKSTDTETREINPEENDPLIGLFSGSSQLATQSEAILSQEIKSKSGLTWKK
jgi:hypothetical protein